YIMIFDRVSCDEICELRRRERYRAIQVDSPKGASRNRVIGPWQLDNASCARFSIHSTSGGPVTPPNCRIFGSLSEPSSCRWRRSAQSSSNFLRDCWIMPIDNALFTGTASIALG